MRDEVARGVFVDGGWVEKEKSIKKDSKFKNKRGRTIWKAKKGSKVNGCEWGGCLY
jgi:hypothetical protein